MSESEKRKRMERIAVTLLDVLAIVISYMVSLYVRNGSFVWNNQRISWVSVMEYILLVYLLVSFFRNTKKDFFKRGYMKELVDIVKETSCVAAILIITMFLFKMDNDPRITKVGKFIRKTSIDELPRFWNVLKGVSDIIKLTKKKPYFMGFVGA